MQKSIRRPKRHIHAVELRPRIQAHVMLQHHADARQLVRDGAELLPQRREHKQVERHEGRRWVPRERKHELTRRARGDGRERRWLPRLHRYSAKVDCAVEGLFEDGFQQVELAHGHAARGDDDVGGGEGVAQGCFQRPWTVCGDAAVEGRESGGCDGAEQRGAVRVPDLAELQHRVGVVGDELVACAEDRDRWLFVHFDVDPPDGRKDADFAADAGYCSAFAEDGGADGDIAAYLAHVLAVAELGGEDLDGELFATVGGRYG